MRRFKHLSKSDRIRIETLNNDGKAPKEIAEVVGVHISTIYRELQRGQYTHRNSDWTEETRYSSDLSEMKYRANLAAKGADLKIGNDHRLAEYIETKIADEKYSPEAVLGEIIATIQKEQGIIGQEIRMYDDNPDWRMLFALCGCLYENHPIRSDIAGTVESIAEITPEMLYDSCRAFYAPDNMVLAAAGDTTMERVLAACARHGLMEPRSTERVQRLWTPEPMTLVTTETTLKMPVSKPCFGLGFKEEPLPEGDLRTEALYDLILCCIVGGMSPLYRRLYDEGLVNPGFGGEVLRVDGCCCILFTGESDAPDAVKQMLLDEIARIRAAGVDREIFTLCKNEKYGQLIENLENVEDSASQMADFALSGQTVAQQITMLAGLTAEDADAALQHILSTDRMAVMDILPDGTAPLAENEEEAE